MEAAHEKSSCASGSKKLLEVNDSTLLLKWNQVHWKRLKNSPIPSSKVNPYRAVVLIHLVALAFFFRYQLVNPVSNAYGLWLSSILCEAWFALSWILDQLPKLQPFNRETYPEHLCSRYNYPEKECQFTCIDVHVTITDHLKEPPFLISNIYGSLA